MSNILMCGNEPLGLLQGNASDIIFTPTSGGGLISDNVQDAITELDTNKVSKSGDTMTGTLAIEAENSGTSMVTSQINLGNNIATGTEGNSAGAIALFADSQYCSYMVARNLTADRVVYFPNKAGTVALTKDLPLKCTNINYHSSGSTLNIKIKIDGGFVAYTRTWLMFVTAAGAAPTIQFVHAHTEGGNVPSVSIYTILKVSDDYVYSVSNATLDSNNNMDIVFTRTKNTYDSLQIFYTTELDIEYSL